MHEFHNDKKKYFEIQYKTSAEYIIPFIEDHFDFTKKLHVLEIGCAEAGVLKAFTDKNHQCVGIELMQNRIDLAKDFMADEISQGKISFITKNIYDIDVEKDIGNKFDLIILKDVIEHIPSQEVFMRKIGDFLNVDGKIFFGFPPWQMPFGGHQQICRSKYLSYLPYFHLLPMSFYKAILKFAGEEQARIQDLVEIKETGISLERFEKIVKTENFKIVKKYLFFINPIYKYKFGLKPRKQLRIIAMIPYLRNFFTTCGYYLIEKKK